MATKTATLPEPEFDKGQIVRELREQITGILHHSARIEVRAAECTEELRIDDLEVFVEHGQRDNPERILVQLKNSVLVIKDIHSHEKAKNVIRILQKHADTLAKIGIVDIKGHEFLTTGFHSALSNIANEPIENREDRLKTSCSELLRSDSLQPREIVIKGKNMPQTFDEEFEDLHNRTKKIESEVSIVNNKLDTVIDSANEQREFLKDIFQDFAKKHFDALSKIQQSIVNINSSVEEGRLENKQSFEGLRQEISSHEKRIRKLESPRQ